MYNLRWLKSTRVTVTLVRYVCVLPHAVYQGVVRIIMHMLYDPWDPQYEYTLLDLETEERLLDISMLAAEYDIPFADAQDLLGADTRYWVSYALTGVFFFYVVRVNDMSFALARPSDKKVAVLLEYRTFEGRRAYRKVFRKRATSPRPVRYVRRTSAP